MKSVDQHTTLSGLRESVLFSGLPDAILAAIVWAAEPVSFASGDVLIHHGTPSRTLLVVLQGLAAITPMAPWQPGQTALSWVKPGESVGEIGILTGETRSSTVTAATHIQALRLSRDVFLEMMRFQPHIGVHLSKLLAQRLSGEIRRQIVHKRHARLIVILVTDGEDGQPLADALVAAAEGAAITVNGDFLRHDQIGDDETPQTMLRMVGAIQSLEQLLSTTDVTVIVHPIETARAYLRPLLERAHIVLSTTAAAEALPAAEVRALAGVRPLTIMSTVLAAEEAGGVLDRLGRPHEVAVFIPTTIDVNQEIDPTPHIEAAKALFGTCFGGATVQEAEGVWSSDEEGLVGERIWLVSTACSHRDFNAHLDEVTTFVLGLKETLRQEAMAMRLDGRLVLL
ncbi:MAG: cyclic nucleotide-binding domain-containing protein [Myxococcota bacterium]